MTPDQAHVVLERIRGRWSLLGEPASDWLAALSGLADIDLAHTAFERLAGKDWMPTIARFLTEYNGAKPPPPPSRPTAPADPAGPQTPAPLPPAAQDLPASFMLPDADRRRGLEHVAALRAQMTRQRDERVTAGRRPTPPPPAPNEEF